MLGGCVLLGILIALPRYAYSLNVDEPWTANLMLTSWETFWATFRSDPTTPLYYVSLRIWTGVWGVTDNSVRTFSLASFAATIVAVGVVVRHFHQARAGLLAAFLMAVSMGAIMAATARPYALLGLIAALTAGLGWWLATAEEGDRRPPRREVLAAQLTMVGLGAAGLLTHPIFIFLLAALTVASLLISWRAAWRLAFCAALSLVIFLAIWGPMLMVTMGLPARTWMATPRPRDLIESVMTVWGGNTAVVVAGCVGAAVWRPDSLKRFWQEPLGRAGLAAFGLTFLLAVTVGQFYPVFEKSRFPILVTPLACWGLAWWADHWEGSWLRPIWLGALAASTVLIIFSQLQAPDPWPNRTSVQTVLNQITCGDQVVVGGMTVAPVTYYWHRLGAPACVTVTVYPAEMRIHPGWLDKQGMLTNQGMALAAEARELAERLRQTGTDAVWVFYGTPEVTSLLTRELRQLYPMYATYALSGSYFNMVLRFGPRVP